MMSVDRLENLAQAPRILMTRSCLKSVKGEREAALSLAIDAAKAGSAWAWRVLGAGALAACSMCDPGLFRSMVARSAEEGDAIAKALIDEGEWSEERFAGEINAEVVQQLASAWMRSLSIGPVEVEQISSAPRAFLARRVLNDFECAYLRALATPFLAPSEVYMPSCEPRIDQDVRSSRDIGYPYWKQDIVVASVVQRLTGLVGSTIERADPLSIVHYATGGRFTPHFDTHGKGKEPDAGGGLRAISVIGYLNDGYVGGETAFLAAKRKVAGARGDVIYFHNLTDDGELDRASLHASLPIDSGEKWIFALWFRERVLNDFARVPEEVLS